MSSPMTERLRSKPISIPPMAEPISVTAMMPMMTPRAVRAERILCALMTETAMRIESTISRSTLLLRLLLDGHLRAVLQLARDRSVRAGHHFVAGLQPATDLDEGVVGDAGLHLLHLHLFAGLDEDDALQLRALDALFLPLGGLVGDVGLVIAALARLALHALPLQFLGRLIALGAAHGDALDRHGHDVLHRRRLDVRGGAH